MTTGGRANTAMLQNFGVIFGYNRVVIYIEPISEPGFEILPNTSRSALLANKSPLPWAEWQDEFRKAMPSEIAAHMEAVASASQASDHKESIKERLKQIEDLYKLSRYHPTKMGSLMASGESPAGGGGSPSGDKKASSGGSGKTTAGTNAGSASSIYNLFLSDSGTPAIDAKPDLFPKVNWVSVTDKTREPDDMDDRAAKYIEKDNQLLINADFRVYNDMIKRWTEYFSTVPRRKKSSRRWCASGSSSR